MGVWDDKSQRVRERAYQIWIEEGRPHGRDREHWFRAEREMEEGDETKLSHDHERHAQVRHDQVRDDQAGLGAAKKYDERAKKFSENAAAGKKAREAEQSVSGAEAEKLKKAEAAGKARSKAPRSSGNI